MTDTTADGAGRSALIFGARLPASLAQWLLFVLSLVAVVVAAALLTPRKAEPVGAEDVEPELLLEAA